MSNRVCWTFDDIEMVDLNLSSYLANCQVNKHSQPWGNLIWVECEQF